MKAAMEQETITRQEILSELFRSPHGKLADYLPIGRQAVAADAEFVARGIAWAKRNGTVRDANLALPVVTLSAPSFPKGLRENSLAHLALLTPRQLIDRKKGVWAFARSIPLTSMPQRRLRQMLHDYLRAREDCWPWWERTVLNFRKDVRTLYKVGHVKPSAEAQAILFEGKYPEKSIFAQIVYYAKGAGESDEIAGFIRGAKLPTLVAQGMVGQRIKEPSILAAVVDTMTPAQLMKRMKAFKAWGYQGTGATRGAVTAALGRAGTRGRRDTTLVTTKAMEAIAEDDPLLAVELEQVQEAQIDAQQGIEGDWLIFGDISSSMRTAIEPCRLLSGYLARRVQGKILLGWFNHEVFFVDVTGKTYAEIQRMTQHVAPSGGTSMGAALAAAQERGFAADAMVFVSDGEERDPPAFTDVYARYSRWLDKQPPVYLYRISGNETDSLSDRCQQAGFPYQVFPVSSTIDEYGLGALAETMKTKRYSLIQQVMDTPLLTLSQALKPPKEWRIHR